MKALIGQAPLLPWWRVAAMSDAEIREFNSKFYVEIEMTDDNLDDTQQSSVGKPIDVGKYYTYDEIALLSAVTKNVWNAAIEEAAKICDERNYTYVVAERIRKLKII